MNEGTQICVNCREEIKQGAVKCIRCDSFQDWRRYFSASSLFLSLLVALVTSMTTLIHFVTPALTPKRAVIHTLEIAVEQRLLRVGFTNSGTALAAIRGAKLSVKRDGSVRETFELNCGPTEAKRDVDPFLEPGKSRIIEFHPVSKGLGIELPRKITGEQTCTYEISFDIVGFGHSTQCEPLQIRQCVG
jgi:hypothetical protein